jgi:hypothetical protein
MLAFALTAVGLALVSTASIVLTLAIGGLTYVCLFVLYAPFFYTMTTSLSVQTLVMLLRNRGELTEAELYRHFASYALAHGRLAVLHRSGYIEIKEGRYRATIRGRLIARVFSTIKVLWKLGQGG